MATTQVHETPAFYRITSKGRPTSWAVGLPVAIVVVLLIGCLAYFASKATSYSEQLGQAQQTATQQQQTLESAQKRLTTLEAEHTLYTNPGKATVLLQPAAKGDSAWGAAVFGDMAGKAFVQLRAYGLKDAPQGKAYLAWLDAGGKPLLIGMLDAGPNGAAFTSGKDLAPTEKATRVFVTLSDEKAKAPGDEKPIMEASLQAPAKKDEAE